MMIFLTGKYISPSVPRKKCVFTGGEYLVALHRKFRTL